MTSPRYTTTRSPAASAAGAAVVGRGQIHGCAHLAMRAAVHVGGTPKGGSNPRRAAPRSREGHSDARFVPVGVAGRMVQLHQVPSSRSRAFGDVQFPRAPKLKEEQEVEKEAYDLI